MLGIIFISLYFSASLWTLSSKFFSVNFETSESLFPSTSALGVGVTATSPASNYRAGKEELSGVDWTTPHVGGRRLPQQRGFELYGILADMLRAFFK